MPAQKEVTLSPQEKQRLQKAVKSRTSPQRLIMRSRIVLLASEPAPNVGIAQQLAITKETAGLWRNRYIEEGFKGLTMTHDYKRHGTRTLFAALNAATGEVVGSCKQRHRNEGFLAFLKEVEKQVAPGLAIHIMVDNYATHKHENVRGWLKNNGCVQLHFIPTSSSWLNLVERFFGLLAEKAIRRS